MILKCVGLARAAGAKSQVFNNLHSTDICIRLQTCKRWNVVPFLCLLSWDFYFIFVLNYNYSWRLQADFKENCLHGLWIPNVIADPAKAMGVFLWDDPDSDQWSEITQISVHQRNRRILSRKGRDSSVQRNAPLSPHVIHGIFQKALSLWVGLNVEY